MKLFNYPYCLLGQRVRNVVTKECGTVTDILSMFGRQRVEVAVDDRPGLHRTHWLAEFEKTYTVLDGPRRSAEIIPLDAYRRPLRAVVGFGPNPRGAA